MSTASSSRDGQVAGLGVGAELTLRLERCLSYDEKPLMLFQKLKEGGQKPVFMLRHIVCSFVFLPSITNPPAGLSDTKSTGLSDPRSEISDHRSPSLSRNSSPSSASLQTRLSTSCQRSSPRRTRPSPPPRRARYSPVLGGRRAKHPAGARSPSYLVPACGRVKVVRRVRRRDKRMGLEREQRKEVMGRWWTRREW